MNTLNTFWEIEDGGVRGDAIDGVDQLAAGKHAEIRTPDGQRIPVTVTNWDLQIRTAEPEKINLFCMYALRWDENAPQIDPKLLEFGESTLIFTDPNKFQERLYDAARKLNRNMQANLVIYVPNDYVGEIGLFRKRQSYAYQSEWRLALFDGLGNPIKLELGDLTDISILIPTSELKNAIQHP